MDEPNLKNHLPSPKEIPEREIPMESIMSDDNFHRWIEDGIEAASDNLDRATRRHLDESVKGRIRNISRRNRRSVALIAIAAVLAGFIAGGFAVHLASSPAAVKTDPVVVATGPSETARVTLPDGTLVTVNNESTLTYNFESDNGIRSAICDGEAFFEVAPNADHPFIVTNGDLSVKCLGTSFDMKAYRDEPLVTVALATGRICATAGESSVTIDPNNIVEYSRKTGRVAARKITASDYTEWTDGYLRFNNEPLGSIARTLQRKYGVRIDIPESVAGERISGNVGRCGVRDILKMLCLTSNLNYTEVNDSTFAVSR